MNRGPSDFDIRNSASVALTYDIPSAQRTRFVGAISQGWSTENIFQARSAPPVNVSYFPIYLIGTSQSLSVLMSFLGNLYLYGSPVPGCSLSVHCPGGKGFNPAAFTPPPLDPTHQRTNKAGRLWTEMALRGFGAWQWDFAAHRDFPLGEHLKLQFRAELFNVLNHPNFGPPIGVIWLSRFRPVLSNVGPKPQ